MIMYLLKFLDFSILLIENNYIGKLIVNSK